MKVTFLLSAASTKDFIQDERPKLILAGRSNVGKSSLINRMAGTKGIARVSSTPGKTAFANYYLVDDRCYWVDLPGYGYAKVSHKEQLRWAHLMEDFFAQLDDTYTGVLIVDCRHKPTTQDVEMAALFRSMDIPFLVLANKLDKLKRSQVEAHLAEISETLSMTTRELLLPFSAEKGDGKERLEPIMRAGTIASDI